MLFENYANRALLCNVSVNGQTGTSDVFAFRGDMVVEEGDIADAQGRRHPPKVVLKQAVVLCSQGKLSMVAGALEDIAQVPQFVGKYGADFGEGALLLFYVANISQAMKVSFDGSNCILIPHDEGAVWTMLMDDLRLEKSDFKGQNAQDKVITMFDGLKDFNPKYEDKSYDDALSLTIDVRKEARGPV